MDNSDNIVEWKKCRLCFSENIKDLFSLGNLYINDFVKKENIGKGRKAPLDLFICNNCSLIQLKHTAPQELLYSGNYWYKSGVTQTMRDGLKEIAKLGEEICKLKEGDIVLDIGANDGTLLDLYDTAGLKKIGCEPAKNLQKELSKTTSYVMNDFWSYESLKKNLKKWNIDENSKIKYITALGMFYDMEDPNQFVRDVEKSLSDDGVFIAQLMCLKNMLKTNDIGNICHEHIEFYSLKSLKYLFENNGLEIYKIEENNINGGSYRIFSRKYSKGSINFEEKVDIEELENFKKRIDKNKEECVKFIKNEVSKGKKVYVYGASTKGNSILQYYNLDNKIIEGAADRSPEKHGKYTVGSWIPIYSEDYAREVQPDYFFVLPWGFFNEMYKREENWRKNGGKFILCTPEFRVVE